MDESLPLLQLLPSHMAQYWFNRADAQEWREGTPPRRMQYPSMNNFFFQLQPGWEHPFPDAAYSLGFGRQPSICEPVSYQGVDRGGINPCLHYSLNPTPGLHTIAVDMSRPSLSGPLRAIDYHGRNGAVELPQATERLPAFDQGTRKVNILVQFETGSGRWTWATTIETNSPMTVRQFVEAFHRKLFKPVGDEELEFAARKAIWKAARDRRVNAHTFSDGDKRKVCRVDMLDRECVFQGLHKDRRVIDEKYGADSDEAAIAWVAKFGAP